MCQEPSLETSPRRQAPDRFPVVWVCSCIYMHACAVKFLTCIRSVWVWHPHSCFVPQRSSDKSQVKSARLKKFQLWFSFNTISCSLGRFLIVFYFCSQHHYKYPFWQCASNTSPVLWNSNHQLLTLVLLNWLTFATACSTWRRQRSCQGQANEQTGQPVERVLGLWVGGAQPLCFHVDEKNNVRVWHQRCEGQRREGGGETADSHTHAVQAAERGGSSVTSTDRNRRTCGAGCALFVSRLSESTHSRSYDWGWYKQATFQV